MKVRVGPKPEIVNVIAPDADTVPLHVTLGLGVPAYVTAPFATVKNRSPRSAPTDREGGGRMSPR